MEIKEGDVVELVDGKSYLVTEVYLHPLGYECESLEAMGKGYLEEGEDISKISVSASPEDVKRVVASHP